MLYENKISEIKGLEDLENLTVLSLMANQIPEIKGLENLKSQNFISINLRNVISSC